MIYPSLESNDRCIKSILLVINYLNEVAAYPSVQGGNRGTQDKPIASSGLVGCPAPLAWVRGN